MRGRVLVIAGSDSGGGAGIQADIKTITALGGFAATAITALTAQNTLGVRAVHTPPPDILRAQIDAVIEDIGADAVKTGMIPDAQAVAVIAEALAPLPSSVALVIDPVMVATSGARLGTDAATAALVATLFPRAALITPNLPEAAHLTGREIAGRPGMIAAARQLLALGPRAVLIKGGHGGEAIVGDLLATRDAQVWFEAPRIDTRHTHGTGCTLASAIATGLAQGLGLREAVGRAHAFVQRAIETAPGLGHGHGPLNHAHTVTPFR